MWNNLLARVQNGRFGDVRLWPMRCSFDLYAVYSQTGVMGIRSDRVDLLNTQVTLRGHCTTHVLRDRQLAANHLSTVLSRERGEKIKPLKRFILSGRSRCRGFGWRATAFFPLKYAARFFQAWRGRLVIRPKRSTAVLPVCWCVFYSLFFKPLAILLPVFALYLTGLCKRSRVTANGRLWLAVATWTRCLVAILRR